MSPKRVSPRQRPGRGAPALPSSLPPNTATAGATPVNWRQVIIFLVLTLGLTWLIDLAIWVTVGFDANSPVSDMSLQAQVLLPALIAILLQMYVFADSPIHFSKNIGRARWFYYFVILLAGLYLAASVVGLAAPNEVSRFQEEMARLAPTPSAGQVSPVATVGATPGALASPTPGAQATPSEAAGAPAAAEQPQPTPPLFFMLFGMIQMLNLISVMVLLLVWFLNRREAEPHPGLQFGKLQYWLIFGAGIGLFYLSQALLNYVFNLGQPVDTAQWLIDHSAAGQGEQLASTFRESPWSFWGLIAAQVLILLPVQTLVVSFGKEYGWRGYLQSALTRLGRVKGVLLVGLFWGLWQAPVAAMGYSYPGQPELGVVVMIAYSVALAFVLGYVVLKSGSIWPAAFGFAINSAVNGVLTELIFKPNDPILCFGTGLFGVVCLAAIGLALWQDPIWQAQEG